MRYIFTLILLAVFAQIGDAQKGVIFRDFDFTAAVQVAQIEDKPILIDTYTPWCGPCKKMNIVFQNKELARYYNKHFLNVKYNVAAESGREVKSKFDVFFLPTILILDKFGNILYKNEGIVSSDELLALGKHFVTNGNQPPPIASKKPQKPVVVKSLPTTVKKESVKVDPNEKLLYVADDDDLPNDPSFLYEYAYLQLRLGESDMYKVADAYLATQEDWLTEKNIRFINDFIENTDAHSFDFLIDHRVKFEEVLGKANVEQTISILINKKLQEDNDSLTFDEVYYLYSIEGKTQPVADAYQFLLNTSLEKKNYTKYIDTAIEYMHSTTEVPNNVIITATDKSIEHHLETDELIELLESVSKYSENFQVFYNLARLYKANNQKKDAQKTIKKAGKYVAYEMEQKLCDDFKASL